MQIAQATKRAREIVDAGYMTISFVDEDCNEARYNYTLRRESLATAGSQILKTNFPTPPTFFPSNFVVMSQAERASAYILCAFLITEPCLEVCVA